MLTKSSIRSMVAYRLGAASLVYRYKSWKLSRLITSRFGNASKRQGDYLIAANDEICQNGGLCDCLHGLVSAYYVAKKYNNQFRIVFSVPFSLTDYLLPNQFDWRIDTDMIDYRSCFVYHVPMMLGRFHATWAEERSFHYRYLCRVARRKGTKLLYSNAHLVGEEEFSQLFSELFRPSPELQSQIDFHLSQIEGPFLGASFRFRNLLGDCIEPDSQPLSQQEQSDLMQRSIRQIEALHSAHPTHSILVTSDSAKFCSSILSLPYVYCIQGVRGHVSYQGKDVGKSSFIDLFLLSKSDENTLFITDRLYHSGFAQTASFIGNVPYRVIRY